MSEKEYRSVDGLSYVKDSEELILEGYAIVWNSETLIGLDEAGKGYYEVIEKGSVSPHALKDVPLKVNHNDVNLILARTRNGSLELNIDDHGLFIRAKLLPEVQAHKDVYAMVKSGLFSKMSFAFICGEHEIDRSGKLPKRIIKKIDKILDVSVVTVPAYEATEIHARSLELVEASLPSLDNGETEHSLEEERKAVELEKLKISLKLMLK